MIKIGFLCLIFGLNSFGSGVELKNCPKTDVRFIKILGFRPADLSAARILQTNDTYPVTLDCIRICRENNKCNSFLMDFNENTCRLLKNAAESNEETPLVTDNSIAWFTKTCIHGKTCGEKAWTFERIPGTILLGNDTKTLPNKVTRNECLEKCISTTDFECRSVKFHVNSGSAKGACTLSDTDRHLMPNSFRAARNEEEYLENQCVTDNVNGQNTFCAYEEYVDVNFQHVDLLKKNITKNECENLCNSSKDFHCRSFSLEPYNTNYNCLLHSEDSKIYGPRLFKGVKNGFYYEKARCLNISVTCTEDFMDVLYRPEINFSGRIYMQGYSDHPECYTKGQGFKDLRLKLPLTSSQCGIIEALSPDNRRLLSASLIIQYNNYIQTQGDRLIKVGCIFGNDGKFVVGTGVTVAPDSLNNGSFLINYTTSSPDINNPSVIMKLLDHHTKEEIADTQIGQELDLIIENSQGNQDIWVGHLIAMTENGGESITLLDDRGCPTNAELFPIFQKFKQNNRTFLVSTFQAFKFPSSAAVRFSVLVQFCPENCPEVDCNSHYRQKRGQIETLNGSRVLRVDRSEFDNVNPQFFQKPLEVMVLVRNHNISPDRLIYGNKVLVAGYNYETNEVCVDYSLLLGIIIGWVLIQLIFAIACLIIVRKYKKYYQEEYMRQAYEEYNKNFGIGESNLDNRRVRWADNGNEMQ